MARYISGRRDLRFWGWGTATFLVVLIAVAATPPCIALSEPSPSPSPGMCESLELGFSNWTIGEGNVESCIDVMAPGECCWESSVGAPIQQLTPMLQCGDQQACFFLPTCDCSGCFYSFEVRIGDRRVSGECRNRTPTPRRTATPLTPAPSATITGPPDLTATPTVTATQEICEGDCNSDSMVTVEEILFGIQLALGSRPISECSAFDRNMDGRVTVDEILGAVAAALTGC